MTPDKPPALYSLERQQTGMFLVRASNGNRIGIISGKAGSWVAERMDGRVLSAFNTRRDAAMALLHCR